MHEQRPSGNGPRDTLTLIGVTPVKVQSPCGQSPMYSALVAGDSAIQNGKQGNVQAAARDWTTAAGITAGTAFGAKGGVGAVKGKMAATPKTVTPEPVTPRPTTTATKTETSLVKYKAWPDEDGFLSGYSKADTLQAGRLIDRYGYDGGRYASPQGTPFGKRGLPSSRSGDRYSVFEVRKPIDVQGGIAAPWMDPGGGGVQFLLPCSIEELLQGGFLGRVG